MSLDLFSRNELEAKPGEMLAVGDYFIIEFLQLQEGIVYYFDDELLLFAILGVVLVELDR